MRTTLTLDDDIAAKLKAEMRRTGSGLKETVNEVLRRGLNQKPPVIPPFEVRARGLGERPGLDFDCTSRLLEEIEGPLYK